MHPRFTSFGRYRLVELLVRGGMGEVWRAHDTETDLIVAITVVPANLTEDRDFQQRFSTSRYTESILRHWVSASAAAAYGREMVLIFLLSKSNYATSVCVW
jgi:serine/threonine protein kinase